MESLADKLRRADGSAEREALRAENEALKTKLAEFEAACSAKDKALLSAKAGVWDGHYGRGVSVAYAQSVEREVNAALATDVGKPILGALEAAKRLRQFADLPPGHGRECHCQGCAAKADFDAKLKAAGL